MKRNNWHIPVRNQSSFELFQFYERGLLDVPFYRNILWSFQEIWQGGIFGERFQSEFVSTNPEILHPREDVFNDHSVFINNTVFSVPVLFLTILHPSKPLSDRMNSSHSKTFAQQMSLNIFLSPILPTWESEMNITCPSIGSQETSIDTVCSL